jgi:hypothetical protein
LPYKNQEDMREYQRLWRQRRRDNWFREHGPCTLCGSWRFLKVFSYKVTIPKSIWSLGEKRMYAILAECVPLCGSCHRKEAFKRQKPKAIDAFNQYKSVYFPENTPTVVDDTTFEQLSLFHHAGTRD